MAQVTRVIQADPWKLQDELIALAATEEIQIVTKTYSAGKFLVVSDNAGGTGQQVGLTVGDPDKLASEINDLIALPSVVEIVEKTFSGAHYIVVYK